MAVDTSTVELLMPAMGDSVTEGTVLEWHKQEGDSVAADETIVEISTDKVDAEVPAPVSGTIIKIHAGEGDTVAVGAVMAEIDTGGNGAAGSAGNGDASQQTGGPGSREASQQAGGPVSGEAPPATAEEAADYAATEAEGVDAADAADAADTAETSGPAEATKPPADQTAAVPKSVDIVTPTGGESVTEGTILQWSVKVGDEVKDGDTVVEISTDKVDMELPAASAGTITEILAEEGETVTVGQVIGRISLTARDAPPTAPPGSPRDTPQAQEGGPQSSGPPAPGGDSAPANASPVARRVAADRGVDLNQVIGTARGGRITKSDVLAAGNGSGSGATAGGRLSRLRAIMPGGVVTAGNAAQQNDAAAACLVVRADRLEELGLEPAGYLRGWTAVGCEPATMGIGPVPAVAKLFARTGVGFDDLDLIELNEAFAVQVLAVLRGWGLKLEEVQDRLNVNGSGISLGHPVGATGARILTTMLHELRRRRGRYALETMCVGGGQGVAALFEAA